LPIHSPTANCCSSCRLSPRCYACPAQVLLVNLVTSTTLGLALAAEPPEPTTMDQPPRRQGKRLVGKLLLWRMFFVCHVVVCLVLGMFAWAQATGHSLGQSRAEAFNVLVGAQVGAGTTWPVPEELLKPGPKPTCICMPTRCCSLYACLCQDIPVCLPLCCLEDDLQHRLLALTG
jgi:hypothetical protein